MDEIQFKFDGGRTLASEGFQAPVEPLTKVLYGYQLAALESILEHRRVILGLEPGMGKTAILQATAAAEVKHNKKVLIVVPPSLQSSPWDEEFVVDYPHIFVEHANGYAEARFGEFTDVVIIPDSVVAKRLADIEAWGPEVLLIDEAHRFKTPGSQRTKAMVDVGDLIPEDGIVVCATGTLSVNHAGDVYHPLRITGEKNAKAVSYGPTWTDFLDVHCVTEIAWKRRVVTGCQDVEWLRKRLMSTCMINVPRDEVLDLPPRQFTNVNLTLPQHSKGYKEYKYAQRYFLDWVEENFGEKAAERSAKAEAMTKLMRLWELDGKAKMPATVDYVQNLVDQDEQVVVMGWHSSVLDQLRDELTSRGARVVMVRGGMSKQAKADAKNLFQDGKVDVLIGQIESAGTGLTLTAARHLVFAQLPWSPAAFGQAADRIYRIGQERSVQIHMLSGQVEEIDMVSTRMWGVLCEKAKVTDVINNGKPSTIDPSSIVSEVLASYGW